MKSKKTMLILPVAVVALCAVALIGAGFAAPLYTGTTQNTNNDVNSAYITLDLEQKYVGSFDKEILYNTVTNYNTETKNVETTYTPLGTTSITVVNQETETQETKNVVDLGSVTVNVVRTDADAFVLNVNDSAEIEGTYFISYTIGQNTKYAKYTGNFDTELLGSDSSTPIKIIIHLYLEVETGNSAPETNPMTGVAFTFTATVDDGVEQN